MVDNLDKQTTGTPICLPGHAVLVLELDASQKGWGARCMETSTGGCWSTTEAQNHINYLELLAAFLALKTFASNQKGLVLLKMDNTSAVTYINQKGGTHSTQLCDLALQIWEWCIQKEITLQAEHLPGCLNIVADSESRTIKDQCHWMINPRVFQQILQSLGPLEVDLFASHLTKQLPRYYSWRPDPKAEATDTFLQNWAQVRGFANPPWCLIAWCLSQIKCQQAGVLLVTPLWPCQPWFPCSPPQDVTRLSSPTPISTGPDSEPHQSGIHNATRNPSTGRMARLRESFTSRGFSTQASHLLLSSWRDKTNTSYNSLFAKWANWCEQRDRDPTVGPVEDMINFLAELFAKGYQYRSLNAYQSAISSIYQKVDGQNIGQHPLVCRLLKGAFNQNPPTQRYTHFWDVGVVLRYLKQLGPTHHSLLNGSQLKQLCSWPSHVFLDQPICPSLTYTSRHIRPKESFFRQLICPNRAVHQNQ